MAGSAAATACPRIGLINLEVPPEHRRKGYGRFLVSEIFRRAATTWSAWSRSQTVGDQPAGLALYASLGFQPVDQATLYRLPGNMASGFGISGWAVGHVLALQSNLLLMSSRFLVSTDSHSGLTTPSRPRSRIAQAQ